MHEFAINIAKKSFDEDNNASNNARFLKDGFDIVYGEAYECFVGFGLGFYITNNRNEYIYFQLEKYQFVLFMN